MAGPADDIIERLRDALRLRDGLLALFTDRYARRRANESAATGQCGTLLAPCALARAQARMTLTTFRLGSLCSGVSTFLSTSKIEDFRKAYESAR